MKSYAAGIAETAHAKHTSPEKPLICTPTCAATVLFVSAPETKHKSLIAPAIRHIHLVFPKTECADLYAQLLGELRLRKPEGYPCLPDGGAIMPGDEAGIVVHQGISRSVQRLSKTGKDVNRDVIACLIIAYSRDIHADQRG